MDYTEQIKKVKHEVFELEFKLRINKKLSIEDNNELIRLKKELRELLVKKVEEKYDKKNTVLEETKKAEIKEALEEEKFEEYYAKNFTYRGKKLVGKDAFDLASYRLNYIKNRTDNKSLEEIKFLKRIISMFDYQTKLDMEKRKELISYYTNSNKGR